QATGLSLAHAGGTERASRSSRVLSGGLVAAEVAAAVLVVSGAGLLLRTWSALANIDPGYRTDELFTATVNLPFPAGPAAPYPDGVSIRQFQARLERELT